MEFKSYRIAEGDILDFDKVSMSMPNGALRRFDLSRLSAGSTGAARQRMDEQMIRLLPILVKLTHEDPQYRRLIASRLSELWPSGFALDRSRDDLATQATFWQVLGDQTSLDFEIFAKALGQMVLRFDELRIIAFDEMSARESVIHIVADKLRTTPLEPSPQVSVQEGTTGKPVISVRRTMRKARSF